MKNKLHIVLKILFLSFCSIIYFLEFFFYYAFSSPVDPGFQEDQGGDLKLILGLCFIKVIIIIVYVYILSSLKIKYTNSYICILFLSLISTITYLPVVSLNYNIIITIRMFTPVIVNILIILAFGIYLSKSWNISKRLKQNK